MPGGEVYLFLHMVFLQLLSVLCLCISKNYFQNGRNYGYVKRVSCRFIYHYFHNILRFLDVLQIFFSPQVKRCAIITYKHGIHDFAQELLNDLRLRKLGNIKKVSKNQTTLEKQKLNFSPGAPLHTKYPTNDCSPNCKKPTCNQVPLSRAQNHFVIARSLICN